jgi:DNA gyrase inhibitor GyrI
MRSVTIPAILGGLLLLSGCRSDGAGEELPARIVDVPARQVVYLSANGGRIAAESTIEQFTAEFEEQGLTPAGLLMLACARDGTRHTVMVPVLPGTEPEPPLGVRKMPPMKAAAVVLKGSPERIAGRFDEIDAWARRQGWRPEGPRIEVRLASGNRTEVLVSVVRPPEEE